MHASLNKVSGQDLLYCALALVGYIYAIFFRQHCLEFALILNLPYMPHRYHKIIFNELFQVS